MRDGDSVHEHQRAPRDDEPSKWPDEIHPQRRPKPGYCAGT
jgi:hypothetical protein